MRIGRKVWQNECGGTVAGLTSWNAGENFASLGIGHFIWYPAGRADRSRKAFLPLFATWSGAEQNCQNSCLGEKQKLAHGIRARNFSPPRRAQK
jgi:hypothetical protein